MTISRKILFFLPLFVFFFLFENTKAQVLEPPVREIPRDISTLKEKYGSGFGFNFLMNNFGFGFGGEMRHVVAPQTELTASLRLTALRDASEQTFTDFFFGQQIIPNKYQRAFGFPLMLGIRQRLFADVIQEDYRFFVSAAIGPAAAFSYPYFDDINDNGFREQFANFFEPVNDVFTGWSDGEWHWGGAGEFKIGLDIGTNFTRLNSIEFGYFFYYFPNNIQIMMPNQPALRQNVQPGQSPFQFDQNGDLILEPFFEPQSFFGSPQITFTFGWFW
jgi:hypothetical protein